MNTERKALVWLFVIVAVVVLALLLYSASDADAQLIIEDKIYLPFIGNGPTPRPTPSPAPTMPPFPTPLSGYPAPPVEPTPTYVDPWVLFCEEFYNTNWCVDPSTRPDIDNPYAYWP